MYQWEGLEPTQIDTLMHARDGLTYRLWLVTRSPAANVDIDRRPYLRVSRFAQVAELSQFLSRVEPLRHGLRGQALISCRDQCRELTPLLDIQGTTEAMRQRLNAALAPHLEITWWGTLSALRDSTDSTPQQLRALFHESAATDPLPVGDTAAFVRMLLNRHASDSETGTVIVYSRAPRPGHVKTRLIPALGANGASQLQRRLLARMLERSAGLHPGRLTLAVSPGRNDPWLWQRARAVGAEVVVQPTGDLGRRMRLSLAAATHEAPWAVLIGGDCPGLTARSIERAFAALQSGCELVVTPAADGGFGLIGARQALPAVLFQGVPWGSNSVMSAMQRNARRTGIALRTVDRCWDVDRPADLRRLRTAQGNAHDGISRW